jgi:thiol-disulfide isomerase/thioredoxin
MKSFLFLTFFGMTALLHAQCSVELSQTCGHRSYTLFYRDGSEGASFEMISDSAIRYLVPVSEPTRAVIVDDSTHAMTPVWIVPDQRRTRRFTIDHCSGQIIHQDTLPVDLDDSPDQGLTEDYTAGRISSTDSLIARQDRYEEQYINAHPDSFLSLYYLSSLLRHLDIQSIIKYRDMLKTSSHYNLYGNINSYISNYHFKAIPAIGDSLFEFQARHLDGRPFDSRQMPGGITILFFWYSGCGPCHRAMPALDSLYAQYHSQGLQLLSFSADADLSTWQKGSSAFHIPGQNISDLEGFNSPLFLHYAISAFPTFIVFDRHRKLELITTGEDEAPLLKTTIQRLINIK